MFKLVTVEVVLLFLYAFSCFFQQHQHVPNHVNILVLSWPGFR